MKAQHFVLALVCWALPNLSSAIPIKFHLDHSCFLTMVIEDERGNRIRNLLSEVQLSAGDQIADWDGFDDGSPGPGGVLVRHRVRAGRYRLRGLTHQGLELRYEFSVNSPGTPPWKTARGDGGWLADHSSPADILFLPSGARPPNGYGNAKYIVCANAAETGDAFVWLDTNGRRLDGTNTGFWGGTSLCRDLASSGPSRSAAYVLQTGEMYADNRDIEVREITTSGNIRRVYKTTFPDSWKTSISANGGYNPALYGLNGIAAFGGIVVVSLTKCDQLLVIDANARQLVERLDVRAPRGLCFDRQGRLYIATGHGIDRYLSDSQSKHFRLEKTVASKGLLAPVRVTIDSTGDLYVADWGADQNVKVFSPSGRWLRTIGQCGGPGMGRYNETHMCHPCGMTIDDRGQLWVAESESYPKRLSVWRTDGSFVRGIYGPPQYGGGGAIDSGDPTRFFYAEMKGGTEFRLDWKTGTSRPFAVYWRSGQKGFEGMPGPAPDRAFVVGGHTYLTNCFTAGLRDNQDRGVGLWLLGSDSVARPVAMAGNAGDLIYHPEWWGEPPTHKKEIVDLWKGKDPNRIFFIWTDLNHDGIAEPSEVQWYEEDRPSLPDLGIGGPGLGIQFRSDLSFTSTYGDLFPAPKLDEDGVPEYDLSKRRVAGNPNWMRPAMSASGLSLTHLDDTGQWVGSDYRGERRWSINPVSEDAPPIATGALIQPSRLLGPTVVPSLGECGPFVAINGEKGAIFLVTLDGLFVATLGGDHRLFPRLGFPSLKRGEPLGVTSFSDEHFHPTINQTKDGDIYVVGGHESSNIWRLTGLETVRRVSFGEVEWTSEALAQVAPTQTMGVGKQARPVAEISLAATAPDMVGGLANWPERAWLPIDGQTSAAPLIVGDKLFVAWKTGHPNLLDNAGGDPAFLFKKGGALDLMLAPGGADEHAHDSALRLLVTRVSGKTRATLYRAHVDGTDPKDRFRFSSPVGTVFFDQVQDVGDRVSLAATGWGYVLSVPLSLLNLHAQGQSILADIGILRGSNGQTTQRLYWSNRNTAIVSDLPSEARLNPDAWGVWKLPFATPQLSMRVNVRHSIGDASE